MVEVFVALIGAVTTIFTVIWQSRRTNQRLNSYEATYTRNDAKQTILQMIVEDKVEYYLSHKLPENYARIHEEYDIYHKNGGNGRMTKKVNEYDLWYKSIEQRVVDEERAKWQSRG